MSWTSRGNLPTSIVWKENETVAITLAGTGGGGGGVDATPPAVIEKYLFCLLV